MVAVWQHGELDSEHYFLDMEMCDMDLSEYISRCSRLTPPDINLDTERKTNERFWSTTWNIMADITNGLAYIHHHGEVHRDLKPQNSISCINDLLTALSSLIISR